jgi:hypothetical protein
METVKNQLLSAKKTLAEMRNKASEFYKTEQEECSWILTEYTALNHEPILKDKSNAVFKNCQ